MVGLLDTSVSPLEGLIFEKPVGGSHTVVFVVQLTLILASPPSSHNIARRLLFPLKYLAGHTYVEPLLPRSAIF